MSIDFSLVVATFGRVKEVEDFLKSISLLKYDLNRIEVIIVDQNSKENIDLSKIVEKFTTFKIKHIVSHKKGSSYNRNLGLKNATGKYVAFPDDDCEYYPYTLEKVLKTFENSKGNFIIGRIIDKERNNVIRDWPMKELIVTQKNFYDKYSAITIFFEKDFIKQLTFDEDLGPGSYYGACEDTDVVYRALELNQGFYNPEIEVFHPETTTQYMDEKKVKSYALGFGAFVNKNKDFCLIFLFIKVILYHILCFMKNFITHNKLEARKRKVAIKYRIIGFLNYSKAKNLKSYNGRS
ncbi:glycosyltransferase family 2 protein [Priestia megaterium]|uniref:glycosyltransferase family 2 protein n=1 Tax=Priestia megaterium TaxID=1404 RepID=UPI0012B9DB64|nr:glycosyltransferase family 2 protein [Priestia megaterium]